MKVRVLQSALTRIIDQHTNFAEFLEVVAEICCEKADDQTENQLITEIWEKRARLIEEVSELVEFEIETGTTVLEIAGERIRNKYFIPLESGETPNPDKE